MSSEAAQKAGGGAMSTRDELANDLSLHGHLYDVDCGQDNGCSCGAIVDYDRSDQDHSGHLADALIAEGWRKKPSRDEVARVIAWGVDGVDGEQFDEAAVDYRLEMLQGADAVLALMDRGQ